MAEVLGLFVVVESYIWLWQGAFPGALAVVIVLTLGLALVSNLVIHGDRPRELGLRGDNLRDSAVEVGAVTAAVALPLLAVGLLTDSVRPVDSCEELPWGLFWSFGQQYLLQAFAYTRLREVIASTRAAAFAAATVFALFHLPNPLLSMATLIMGWISCRLFQRHPNLVTLACSHALLSLTLAHTLPAEWMHGLRVGPGTFRG